MKTKYKFEMLFECNCGDKRLPESKLIWVQEENGIFVVTTIRDGNQLCFGSSCWKKIQKQQKNKNPLMTLGESVDH